MNQRSTRKAPPVPTTTTRQLDLDARRAMRQRADLAPLALAVRAEDNAALLTLVRRTQAGDTDAGLLAVWAVLPRVCAVVRNRRPNEEWRRATDELVTITYLVMIDVPAGEPTRYLQDKLIARARRRLERASEAEKRSVMATGHPLLDGISTRPDHVELQAMARLELDLLRVRAARQQSVRRDLRNAVLATEDDRALTGPERMALLRSRRRLRAELMRPAA